MKRLSLGHWLLIIVGLLCLAVGLLVIFPQIPLSWYPRLHPMPSVSEVLANPTVKPIGLTIKQDQYFLGVQVNFNDVLADSGIKVSLDNYAEMSSEWSRLDARLNETLKWVIDGRSGFPRVFVTLMQMPPIGQNICANVETLAPGRYVAQFSFETPSDETYSYTWVFERTAHGIIPEVTN